MGWVMDICLFAQVCSGPGLKCANKYKDMAGIDEELIAPNYDGSNQKCLQACESQDITVDQTSASYPHESVFKFSEDFCYILLKVEKSCNNSMKRKNIEEIYGIGSCQMVSGALNNQFCANGKPDYTKESLENFELRTMVQAYAKDNIIHLKVFFRKPFYTKMKRDLQTTFFSFIGTLGGEAGLCLGLSLISLFEIFYHIIMGINNSINKHK